MSGLCGWFAPASAGAPIAIERMAAPIGRFERTPLKSASHTRGAVALSGSIDCTSLLHENGLIVALWGGPGQQASLVAQRWRSHGAMACAALSGQFAFAILDEDAGEAMLAVDRHATRPLYYQLSGAALLFSSSQDALLRHPAAGRAAAPEALHAYLVLGAVPGSAWVGQHQLGPGECLRIRGARMTRQTWWRMRFHEQACNSAGAFGAAVRSSVTHAQGHQMPGVMLSGGVASAALAAQLHAPRAEPVPTFSVRYANGTAAHACDPARTAARVLGSRHHEQVVGPADLVDAIPKLAVLADSPCADPSAVAHYYCALLARAEGTLRLLSGIGLGELFGAGPLAGQQRRRARYAAVPGPLRELLIEPLLAHLHGRPREGVEPAGVYDLPGQVVQASRFGGSHALLAPEFASQVSTGAPLALLRQHWWGAQCRSDANRAIALDLRHGLPARLAASQLGCALAGVDVAYPYLDEGVADCASRAAPGAKHGGRYAPHARVLRAMVPGPLAWRAPALTLPLTPWLQSDPVLRALAFDSIADLRRRRLVAASVIDALLNTPMAAPTPGFGKLVWQLMMLEQWFVHRAPHRLLGSAASVSLPCRADDPLPLGQGG